MNKPYDPSYWPPFPVLEISLALREQRPQVGPLLALVDTGADGTFIPIVHIKTLRAPVSGQMIVHPQFGSPYVAHTHTLDILVGSIRLSAIEIVGDDTGNEIILGRNLLNKLVMLLDGPQAQTDVWESRPDIHWRK